jgi:rSAM/selenodomain-associated transferase 2/rSAM/selenodomain-associated transferase 1
LKEKLSIIIPTLNEAAHLPATLEALVTVEEDFEILVVDGGSEDQTREIAEGFGCQVIRSPRAQRATQLNLGARLATGEVFLFLHADKILPGGAMDRIAEALREKTVVGGAFARRFQSNSLLLKMTCRLADWRNRLFGWHLGDQAMFVRNDIFQELNGFRLMSRFEDLDFSRRLGKTGKLVSLRPAVISSARRFERGTLRVTCRDLIDALRFASSPQTILPVSPTVLLFLKAPRPGFVKTRLAADLGEKEACDIYQQLAADSLAQVPADWPVRIHYAPAEAEEEMRFWLGDRPQYHPQPEGDLGHRLTKACEKAFREGASSVILLGGDCPDLSAEHLHECALHLSAHRAVIGPAADGGYWLLALPSAQPHLFKDIPWSTSEVLPLTLERLEEANQEHEQLETLEDIDDLASWRRHLDKSGNKVA